MVLYWMDGNYLHTFWPRVMERLEVQQRAMSGFFLAPKDYVDTKGICMECGWTIPGSHNIKTGKLCFKCGHFKCTKHHKKHECKEMY